MIPKIKIKTQQHQQQIRPATQSSNSRQYTRPQTQASKKQYPFKEFLLINYAKEQQKYQFQLDETNPALTNEIYQQKFGVPFVDPNADQHIQSPTAEFEDQLVFKEEIATAIQINNLKDYQRPRPKTNDNNFRARDFITLLDDYDSKQKFNSKGATLLGYVNKKSERNNTENLYMSQRAVEDIQDEDKKQFEFYISKVVQETKATRHEIINNLQETMKNNRWFEADKNYFPSTHSQYKTALKIPQEQLTFNKILKIEAPLTDKAKKTLNFKFYINNSTLKDRRGGNKRSVTVCNGKYDKIQNKHEEFDKQTCLDYFRNKLK